MQESEQVAKELPAAEADTEVQPPVEEQPETAAEPGPPDDWRAKEQRLKEHCGVEEIEELFDMPNPHLVEQVQENLRQPLAALAAEYPQLLGEVQAGELAADRGYVQLLAAGYSPLSAYLCRYTDRCMQVIQAAGRPVESAMQRGGGLIGEDVQNFTDEQLLRIREAVRRGERVVL